MIIPSEKFTSTLVLNKEYNKKWQFIYAGQRYGTLFALYARMEYHKTKKEIKKIELICHNYKGVINIGIHDKIYFHANKFSILFLAQGLNPNRYAKIDNLDFDMKSGACPFEIYQLIKPIGPNINSVIHPSINSSVFDSEFYHRNSINEFIEFEKEFPKYYDIKTGRDFLDAKELANYNYDLGLKENVEMAVIGEKCIKSFGMIYVI